MKSLIVLILSCALAAGQSAAEWKKKGLRLEEQGKTRAALEAFEKALDKNPKDTAILVKIAKQYGDLMPSLQGGAREQAAQKSLQYSRQALAVGPNDSDAHLAVALSLGKNTEFMGNKEKINASREMKAEAEKALKLNSKSDYAHHLLGRWHQEMADIGGMARIVAKVAYGGIPNGSYRQALEHFEQARRLNPKRLIHQIEYGRTLAMMDREDDARREIKKGLAMPNRDADDAESKARGKETLDAL